MSILGLFLRFRGNPGREVLMFAEEMNLISCSKMMFHKRFIKN